MLRALRKKNRGQSAIEYIVVLTILLLAWFGVSNYFKRGLAGRWKGVVDDLGEQYDPRVTDARIESRIFSDSVTQIVATDLNGGFHTDRIDTSNIIETKTGYQLIGGY